MSCKVSVLVSNTYSLAWINYEDLINRARDRISSHHSLKSSSARAPLPSCKRNTWSVSFFNKCCFCFRPQHVSADVGPLHKKGLNRGHRTPTWPSTDWRPDAQILLGYATDVIHHNLLHTGAKIADFRSFLQSANVKTLFPCDDSLPSGKCVSRLSAHGLLSVLAVCTSETSVDVYETTRNNIPVGCYLHARCRDNLISHFLNFTIADHIPFNTNSSLAVREVCGPTVNHTREASLLISKTSASLFSPCVNLGIIIGRAVIPKQGVAVCSNLSVLWATVLCR